MQRYLNVMGPPLEEDFSRFSKTWVSLTGNLPTGWAFISHKKRGLGCLSEHFGGFVVSKPVRFGCGWSWPPYSPDLSPSDYFTWEYGKGTVKLSLYVIS
jgi:hypothetical protein